jgi:hypothetical protein
MNRKKEEEKGLVVSRFGRVCCVMCLPFTKFTKKSESNIERLCERLCGTWKRTERADNVHIYTLEPCYQTPLCQILFLSHHHLLRS